MWIDAKESVYRCLKYLSITVADVILKLRDTSACDDLPCHAQPRAETHLSIKVQADAVQAWLDGYCRKSERIHQFTQSALIK